MGHSPNPAGVIMALPLAVSKDEQDKAATDNSRQVQEVVATPSKGRWMDVSPQADPPSPDEAISESGTAEESGTASEESGDPPVPTEPAHVALPCVSEEWFECNDEQQSGHHWKVVGGVEAGGILVREGRLLSSTLLAARLETGAVVCAKQVDGVRLEYELVSGRGPTSGWVSMKARGKDLLVALDLVALGLSGVGCPAAADAKVPPSRRPLIIFDWDDTLCPTAWLDQQPELRPIFQGRTDLMAAVRANIDIFEKIRGFEEVLKGVLTMALSIGAVGIVTLSQRSWVTDSARDLFPEVLPLLDDIEIVYAREQGGGLGLCTVASFVEQKRHAMQQVIDRHSRRGGVNTWECLVSIGDSDVERQAALALGDAAVRDRAMNSFKLVKLLERPGIETLRTLLESLHDNLQQIVLQPGVQYVSHIDLVLRHARAQ
mmetsp:Transcript_56064/g.126106  ORF Transcript_56064/g.126106 Transcript_56064/m.126106 type:complete len:432 (-) Transcript_56064:36-1331(-)